jgi:hypothetical protein
MMGFKDFRCARIIRKVEMRDDGVAWSAAEKFYSLVM